VAGLPGFIASIQVTRGRVSNVSYVPSRNSERWGNRPDDVWRELGALRADVAAKVRHGAFHLDPAEGEAVADRIRDLKGIDPTLGLYAAYAYRDAGQIDEVGSVRDFMRKDLNGAVLLDVSLLAEPRNRAKAEYWKSAFRFCPMLMRGWPLFLDDTRIPKTLKRAADHLVPALWTTFDAEGLSILRSAMESGHLR
jgi:hypothetical protein